MVILVTVVELVLLTKVNVPPVWKSVVLGYTEAVCVPELPVVIFGTETVVVPIIVTAVAGDTVPAEATTSVEGSLISINIVFPLLAEPTSSCT